MRKIPRVSFVIPTLNASSILPRCLKTIREQNYPQKKVEIIIADGGSTDNTLEIAKKYGALTINNPKILHEPGKSLASRIAKGELIFYTDADNILAHKDWLNLMVKPYLENPDILGFLPQTEPPPDSSSLNRYLGYLFTDPFSWFVYGNSANPKDYDKVFKPLKETRDYKIYKFDIHNHPLFGLSQGVGTSSKFKRDEIGESDDLLAGIKLIKEGGIIAYVPKAGVYHYHVNGLSDFLRKYRWRIRNNLTQKIKGMGFINREKFLNSTRRVKSYLFIPYSLTLFFPLIDAVRLSIKYKDSVMLWHFIISIFLAILIFYEALLTLFFRKEPAKVYG